MDRCFVVSIDDEQAVLTVAFTDRPPDDDHALVDKQIHEVRVLVPAGLFPPPQGVIPRSTPSQPHEEIVSHTGRLGATTDRAGQRPRSRAISIR